LNTYVYVKNNPIKAIDPKGLDLILVGQGGEAGGMFNLAAQTWVNENSGSHKIVQVNTGKDVINAMKNYAKNNNGIDGLRYFGHSFNQGLAVNMTDGIGSIYSGGLGCKLATKWCSKAQPNRS
jgi:uncharacterized protein RhaS with RHS repeats